MRKLVIFNVGGAHSAYCEFDGRTALIDLGANAEFSPVDNFLKPLASKSKFLVGSTSHDKGKFLINQLFLSHLDKDHVCDYLKFRENFHGVYMTCPNDHPDQNDHHIVNKDLLGVETDLKNIILSDMRNTRIPFTQDAPLVSDIPHISLFYIPPGICESDITISSGYANNISLVLFFKVGDKTVLIPGDILKSGMEYLIDNKPEFKSLLMNDGVDYLLAPHHGLQTSFSEKLFQTIKGGKTRLNIISEKIRTSDSEENRSDVDTRYYSSSYSSGVNSLQQNAVKTSVGHIFIDFDKPETEIIQTQDIDFIINQFL
ncbi:MAG: hypothetical protein HHAS10_04890 [Candidatus Altimarinota bacterium]